MTPILVLLAIFLIAAPTSACPPDSYAQHFVRLQVIDAYTPDQHGFVWYNGVKNATITATQNVESLEEHRDLFWDLYYYFDGPKATQKEVITVDTATSKTDENGYATLRLSPVAKYSIEIITERNATYTFFIYPSENDYRIYLNGEAR